MINFGYYLFNSSEQIYVFVIGIFNGVMHCS
jgi:hypothetical protein